MIQFKNSIFFLQSKRLCIPSNILHMLTLTLTLTHFTIHTTSTSNFNFFSNSYSIIQLSTHQLNLLNYLTKLLNYSYFWSILHLSWNSDNKKKQLFITWKLKKPNLQQTQFTIFNSFNSIQFTYPQINSVQLTSSINAIPISLTYTPVFIY